MKDVIKLKFIYQITFVSGRNSDSRFHDIAYETIALVTFLALSRPGLSVPPPSPTHSETLARSAKKNNYNKIRKILTSFDFH